MEQIKKAVNELTLQKRVIIPIHLGEEMVDDGKIYYTMVDTICVIKMVGRIAYRISPNFDLFLEKVKDRSQVKNFVVDLTEATYIDSTNLGLLAKLNRFSRTKSSCPPTIISTNVTINTLLLNIGLSSIFDIVDNANDIQSTFDKLPHMKDAGDRIAEIMRKTHQELAEMSKTDKELFKDVVRYLEGDIPDNTLITF